MKNIPKVCYLYWNGESMSFLHALTVNSFHKYNPDWKIIIYLYDKDNNIDSKRVNPKFRGYTGRDYFYTIKLLDYVEIRKLRAQQSYVHSILICDIWRREILYENGGIYLDFDNIWLKPMSEFKNVDCIGNINDFESLVSFYNYTDGFHNVSNLISEKGSLYMKSLIDASGRVHPPYGDQSFGTSLLNKVYPNLKSITDKFPRVLAVKYETFFPYSTFNMQQLFIANDLSPLDNKNVMGIHWFNGNGISKDYIDEEKYDRNCSMTSILKQEGWL